MFDARLLLQEVPCGNGTSPPEKAVIFKHFRHTSKVTPDKRTSVYARYLLRITCLKEKRKCLHQKVAITSLGLEHVLRNHHVRTTYGCPRIRVGGWRGGGVGSTGESEMEAAAFST